MKNRSSENIPEKDKCKKGYKRMDTSFWVLCALVGILIFIAYLKQGWQLPWSGLVQGGRMFWGMAPNFIVGFALAGVVQAMIPREYIVKMLGEGSGLKGIFIATAAGALAPGGPFINIPLVASFYKSGASVGPLAAFLTAWGIIPISRTIVYEIPLLGSKFALARYGASLIFPGLVGIIASFIFKIMK
ncbi:MAG: permease [Desulfobacterales bacterium]|nr:permease [Desulfobacterales bacterium]